jgi:hypothetical protein
MRLKTYIWKNRRGRRLMRRTRRKHKNIMRATPDYVMFSRQLSKRNPSTSVAVNWWILMVLERFIHTYIHRSKSSSSTTSSYSILLLCACPLLLLLSFCKAPFVCLHDSSAGAVEVGLKQCFGRFFEFCKEPSFSGYLGTLGDRRFRFFKSIPESKNGRQLRLFQKR